MKAAKGNKEYLIDESQQRFYQDSGFDISDDESNVVAYGRGKTVPYEEYATTVNEIKRLQILVTELQEENERLKAKQEPPKAAEDKKEKAVKKEGE